MSQLRDCNYSKDYYLTEKQLEQLKQDFKSSALIVQKLQLRNCSTRPKG